MPGRTPVEAFRAFIDPIQSALGCLARAKITASGFNPGRVESWTINDGAGVDLSKGWHFEAEMHYEVIRSDEPSDGPWRVTTRAYRYLISRDGTDMVRMHWHPAGQSPVRSPHLHIPFLADGAEVEKAHLPISRVSFEDAVQWAIMLSGQAQNGDWLAILEATRLRHIEHQSWSALAPGPPGPTA